MSATEEGIQAMNRKAPLPKIRKHKWVWVSGNTKICQCCGLQKKVEKYEPFRGINGGWATRYQLRGKNWTMKYVPRCNAILEGAA